MADTGVARGSWSWKFLLKQRERQIFVTRCFVARTSLFTVIYDLRPAIICFPPRTADSIVTRHPNFFFLFFFSFFKLKKEKKFSIRGLNAISQTRPLPSLPRK